MSLGITVLGHALKIVNKGGGYQQKMVKEEFPIAGNLLGKKKFKSVQYQLKDRTPGSDYVVYECPMCDKRNKRCVYDAKETAQDGRLVFRCSGCYSEVAVQRPISLAGPQDFGPGTLAKTSGLLGPDGRPLR